MQGHFVGFRIDGFDPDDMIPIATGLTRDEAMDKAITRLLCLCDLNTQVSVVEQTNMPQAQFDTLTKVVDDWARKHDLDPAREH